MTRWALLPAILALALPQDRRIERYEKKMQRALAEVDPRNTTKASEKLVEIGGAVPARILAEALGVIVDRIDTNRRSHYSNFDRYYEYLYGSRDPRGTDRATVLDQLRSNLKILARERTRLDAMRTTVRDAIELLPPRFASPALIRRLESSPTWHERAVAAEVLGSIGGEGAAAALIGRLDADPEPTVRVALLEALAALPDPDDARVAAVSKQVASEYWSIRFTAIQALRRFGRVDALDALVAGFGTSEGRTRAELREAIRELTRSRAPVRDEAVAPWWKANRERILSGQFDTPDGRENAETRVIDYFTIPLHSLRIAFVVDASESMKLSARWNPDVLLGTSKKKKKPKGGRKLALAEFQLLRALDSLPDGARVAVVLYAEVTRTFELGPGTLDDDLRKRLAARMREVIPEGETDLFHAVDEALVYACARDGRIRKDGLDTIYLLSDGAPTMGLKRQMDVIRREVVERNRYARVAVHTIYVGRPGIDEAVQFMRGLAEENQGRFVLATR